MKKFILLAATLSSVVVFSQLGVNTTSPNATLDVQAKNATGTTSTPEGLLVPRVDRQKAQSMTGVGISTLIYVNSVATGTQTGTAVNIDTVGYYYYNGTVWTKFNSSGGVNIYNADGTLAGNRIVTQGVNTLAFTGTAANAFSVDGTTLSVNAASHTLGVGTVTPQKTLHVNGSLQLTNELNIGGNATTTGSSGTSGQVLVSKGAGAAPSWANLSTTSGSISSANYVQGTTALTITQGTVADVPGATITLTVPTGATQTFLFNILGYAVRSITANNSGTQGVFTLLQNGTKISSAYTSTSSTGNLSNLPAPVTFLKSTTLSAGTYIFKIQYASWFGDQIVNFVPSAYLGYNGDTEAMLTKMQVLVYNN
ncbi:hypothetical protein [Chryseobacterium sp. ERMR1:04]|uniref:hypothetical protein n=1 Tax=Chryseobacterium sp. ERMR1:04 TaxID=1705393 RepID=UPI0006C84DC8|nr:hypothetical protein [Chryseobacterium sp. ERMR1:04]